jgi:hypothetical protein
VVLEGAHKDEDLGLVVLEAEEDPEVAMVEVGVEVVFEADEANPYLTVLD